MESDSDNMIEPTVNDNYYVAPPGFMQKTILDCSSTRFMIWTTVVAQSDQYIICRKLIFFFSNFIHLKHATIQFVSHLTVQ